MPYEEGRSIPEACMMMIQHGTIIARTTETGIKALIKPRQELIIIRIGKCLCKYAARQTRYFFLDSRSSRTYFISSRRWQVKQCCTDMRRRKPKIMVQKRRRDVEMG